MNKIILMFLTLTLGGCMTTQSSKAIEKFDELFAGNPVDIEKNMLQAKLIMLIIVKGRA